MLFDLVSAVCASMHREEAAVDIFEKLEKNWITEASQLVQYSPEQLSDVEKCFMWKSIGGGGWWGVGYAGRGLPRLRYNMMLQSNIIPLYNITLLYNIILLYNTMLLYNIILLYNSKHLKIDKA